MDLEHLAQIGEEQVDQVVEAVVQERAVEDALQHFEVAHVTPFRVEEFCEKRKRERKIDQASIQSDSSNKSATSSNNDTRVDLINSNAKQFLLNTEHTTRRSQQVHGTRNEGRGNGSCAPVEQTKVESEKMETTATAAPERHRPSPPLPDYDVLDRLGHTT